MAPFDEGGIDVDLETALNEAAVIDRQGLDTIPFDVVDDLQTATQQHYSDAGSLASGNLGNVVVGFSFGALGDGCNAWKDWMVANLPAHSDQITNLQPIKVYMTSETLGLGVHKLVRFQLHDDPTGTWYIADPWSDPDNPIWRQDAYMKHGEFNIYDYDGNLIVSLPPVTSGDGSDTSLPADEPAVETDNTTNLTGDGTMVDPQRCVRGDVSPSTDVLEQATEAGLITPATTPAASENTLSSEEVDSIFNFLGRQSSSGE